MDILKCTHAVSVTVLLATAPVVPAAAQSANAVLQDTSRQDVGTVFFSRPRPGFCASSRSRECLRMSMPSTFMPWASEPPRSTRRARASIRATRTTVSWQGQDMPATCRTRIFRQTARSKSNWSIRRSRSIEPSPIPSFSPTAPLW